MLSVVEPPAVSAALPLGWGFGELEATERADLTRRIRRAIEAVAAPVEISGEVVDGYADDELARLSREVDLLVCGSRGQGPLGSVMLGNVSTGVLRKARCPVLVVPRGARDGFAALRAPAAAAARPPSAGAPRLALERLAMVRVGDRDQRPGALGQRSAAQVRHAPLRRDVVDGVLQRRHHGALGQARADPAAALRRGRGSTMNALPPSEYIAPRAKSAWPPLEDQ